MESSETVEMTGHLMDTGILSRVLDDVRDYGGDYVIERFDVGTTPHDVVVRPDHDVRRGRRRAAAAADAAADPRRQPGRPRRGGTLGRASRPGCSRRASTPRPTSTPRSGIGATGCRSTTRRWTAASSSTTTATAGVHAPDVGRQGRACRSCAAPPGSRSTLRRADRRRRATFGFMESDVSSEKPQAMLVRQVADGMREAKADGQEGAVGRRPRHRAHRGRAGAGRAGRGRLRRRAVRRQRAGHPRHRVLAVRHLAGRRPGPGTRRRARPRAPHPRAQHDPARPARSRTRSSRAC